MRARAKVATGADPTTAARDSLRARFDAGRAWRLDVPERAKHHLQAAIRFEAQVTPEALRDVYAPAGEEALLAVDLHAANALPRLAELGAESLRRRAARKEPDG